MWFYGLWVAVGLHVLFVWSRAYWRGVRARRASPPQFALKSVPLVSILIPAWEERVTLEATLTTLRGLTYPNWETIVIAGGPDGTETHARKMCAPWPQFAVIPQPPRGKNAAFNLGYACARGEVIVLLDADCTVEPEWLTRLVAPITHGYDASLANYSATHRTPVSDQFEMEKISAYLIRGSTVLHGGGIALRRSIVEQLGGFPEDVTVGVDWDLDQRVTRLGARKAFVPQARHITHLPASLKRYFRDEIRWRRAHLQSIGRDFDGTLSAARVAAVRLSFYLVGVLFFAAPLAGVVGMLISASVWPVHLWWAFWVSVLLRRVGVVLEVLAYAGDPYWLKRLWTPSSLMVVSFLSGLAAMFTLNRRVVFFHGPRSQSA